jgi:hypothetical protein
MANGTTTEPRFVYRGYAVPFGARVIAVNGRPAPRLLTSPPVSALSVIGGRSRGTSVGSSSDPAFKWGATLSESRSEIAASTGSQMTTVSCSLANVSAKNDPITFETDLLKLTVVSNHPRTGQPSIVPQDIAFGGARGIFLNGSQIKVEYDKDFETFPTFALFEKQYRTDDAFFRKYHVRCLRLPTAKPAAFGERLPRVTGGYVVTTFVRRIIYGGKAVTGNVLALTGFGRIYFGEVLMSEYQRRVTMVRLDMGSAMEADAACVEIDSNGSWLP